MKGFWHNLVNWFGLGKRKRSQAVPTRQQIRKLQRETAKLERKIQKCVVRSLNDQRVPKWIRDVKRAQLHAKGWV